MEQVRTWVLTAGAVVLALLILATLVRAVLGPRFTDRIVAVNVISTLVIAELVLLSVWLREDFLVDVALVFALLSFLAVVVVSRLVVRLCAQPDARRRSGGLPGYLLRSDRADAAARLVPVRRKDAADLCVFMADQSGVQPSGRGDGGIHSPGFGKGMRGGGTMIVLEYILLVGVIVCAIAAPLCKRLLASVIVYMALSLMMAVLWSLLQSPDLAITEAAVGAGVTSILFFLTLKKIHALKGTRDE